jgi:hypothetical protein
MTELKTKVHDADVLAFIESFANTDRKRQDSLALIELMREATGAEPRMWGPSMIGFGQYHYKSERSTQQGDWFLIGFSPRKAAISLYVYSGSPEHAHLLEGLGKFTMGKACIYVKTLSDIHIPQLKILMGETIAFLKARYQS